MDLRDRLPRLQALFEEALQYPEGPERESFLDSHCAPDKELRKDVADILEGYGVASAASTGELLRFGPYQVIRLIGRGGMGRVYLAERADGEFQMQVAVKVISGTFLSLLVEDSFRRERQTLAGLNHPNIARLLDGGVQDGAPYLVMEFVDGKKLDDYCRDSNLNPAQRIELLCTVCKAVEYAHSRNIIHRDLKPSNILVTGDGTVKLVDFGSSKLLESQNPDGQTVTSMRALTPDYASPEHLEGRTTSAATDVFSLGVLLSKLCPGEATRVVARATQREPSSRQPSVEAFRIELEEAAHRPRRWWKSRSGGVALVVSAVLAFAGLAWIWPKFSGGTAASSEMYVRLNPPGTRWKGASVSADGKWVAYASDQENGGGDYDIWLRALDEPGKGRRLTDGPARDSETSVSPDGKFVAFYSSRQPAGIYRVEAASGRVELLVAGGRTPKYSPDGRWIAYGGTPRLTADIHASGPNRFVRVIPAAGGTPIPVSAGLPSAYAPSWALDGSELMFQSARPDLWIEQWSVPAGAVLGSRKLVRASPGVSSGLVCSTREQNGQAFTDPGEKVLSLSASWSASALKDPSPADFTGFVRDCSACATAMVVEGVDTRTEIWTQGLDPESGRTMGELMRRPSQGQPESAPALSWDGRTIAYANRAFSDLL